MNFGAIVTIRSYWFSADSHTVSFLEGQTKQVYAVELETGTIVQQFAYDDGFTFPVPVPQLAPRADSGFAYGMFNLTGFPPFAFNLLDLNDQQFKSVCFGLNQLPSDLELCLQDRAPAFGNIVSPSTVGIEVASCSGP